METRKRKEANIEGRKCFFRGLWSHIPPSTPLGDGTINDNAETNSIIQKGKSLYVMVLRTVSMVLGTAFTLRLFGKHLHALTQGVALALVDVYSSWLMGKEDGRGEGGVRQLSSSLRSWGTWMPTPASLFTNTRPRVTENFRESLECSAITQYSLLVNSMVCVEPTSSESSSKSLVCPSPLFLYPQANHIIEGGFHRGIFPPEARTRTEAAHTTLWRWAGNP